MGHLQHVHWLRGREWRWRLGRAGAWLLCLLQNGYAPVLAAQVDSPTSAAALSHLTLEELGQLEVSSVSKRPERLADAAAAIYVITQNDIRRAGAVSLPEALRLAPNLHVALSNSNTYAITARGFNTSTANKLLVLIDGRTVYTPLSASVFWDMQEILLDDVERIEVISGPGGTLWGANAVNGVINIITRGATDTEGVLMRADAGNDDRGVALRDGWRVGEQTSMRLYAKRIDHDGTTTASGTPVADSWQIGQAGFRMDRKEARDSWTLQGDAYEGKADIVNGSRDTNGANLLTRWSRELSGDAGMQLQVYLDHVQRRQVANSLVFNLDLDTIDIDFQHHTTMGPDHEFVWGGGYRYMDLRTQGNVLFWFNPPDSKLSLSNLFAQDTLRLAKNLKLTLGAKIEHNRYTGMEFQPNVRLAYKPDDNRLWWSAISRVVRTPSAIDRNFEYRIPSPPSRLLGGQKFVSEVLTAYEMGYRAQPLSALSYSVSGFFNDYTRLRSFELTSPNNYELGNGVAARTYGIELWGQYLVNERWRLSAGYSRLFERFRFRPGSTDPTRPSAGANDPRYQASLRSSHDVTDSVTFDAGLRAVGALPNPAVSSYTALDMRAAWVVRKGVELSLSGFNILDTRHPEFAASSGPRSEVGRKVVLGLTWQL